MNFDWHNAYPSVRTPVFARNIVSTSQPLAAQAGLRVMAAGGNAADAAVAAAATIALTEPCSNGLGSDNFALIWDPDSHQVLGLNSSGVAPAQWSLEYFANKYANGDASQLPSKRPVRGWDTVTVPGAVAGWVALHERLGKLPFADVLAPAIEYAERGFAVSPGVQDKWERAAPLLSGQPGFAEHFLPFNRAPRIGEHFVLPGAARTLRRIAESHGADFYCGEIAAAMAAHAQGHGGVMTQRDLADYFIHRNGYGAQWVDPIRQGWVGQTGARFDLHEIPPNGQGIAALMALGIVQNLPQFHDAVAAGGIDSAPAQHLLIESMKLAFADTYSHVADPRFMPLGANDLLDPTYLAQRAQLIDASRAQAFSTGKRPQGGTIYLSTADESGMMVSFIQSNYMGFGSGIVLPGWGISLQNRGHCFAMQAGHPNCVAPGKRPFHTIIPAFLTRSENGADVAQMSFGVMGGNMQPQGHLQTLVRILGAGQQPQAACDAPRWKWNTGLDIEVESATGASVVQGLVDRGHRIQRGDDSYMDFGAGQFVWSLGEPDVDGYVAASDTRRDGQAVGY